MDQFESTPKPLGLPSQEATDTLATTAQGSIGSMQGAANKAFEHASDTVDELKDHAAPLLDKVGEQAQKLMQQGRQVFSDTSREARDKVLQASDLAVDYAKEEPIKALLIAAAAGALLMGLVSMMARSDD